MEIKFHGGECCGIKHISGFYAHPSQTTREKPETAKRNSDRFGDPVQSSWNFCWESLPKQTYKERLVAYLDFLKRVRPSGAVEVTLTDVQANINGWGPVLEELGFKKVVSFWNSNSGNNVFVYYLVYGGKKCAIESYQGYLDEDDDYEDEDEDDYEDDYYEGDD